MPCPPLDEDIWHIILPRSSDPYPAGSEIPGRSRRRSSRSSLRWQDSTRLVLTFFLPSVCPTNAVPLHVDFSRQCGFLSIEQTFHDLATLLLYDTVVCCAFDKLFFGIDHDPAKERAPVLDPKVTLGYAHHTSSSTARQVRAVTIRPGRRHTDRAKLLLTTPPTPTLAQSPAYRLRASKMQCLSHVKKLLIIPQPDSRTRIPTALKSCDRLVHDSMLLAKMDTMVRALLLVRKGAPPVLFPGLQTVGCGGVWRDWSRRGFETWPPRADVRDPLAWRQQVNRYPLSERQAAPRSLIEQIAIKSPWSKWYQHDCAPYTGWFSAKRNAARLCVPDRRIVMSDSNFSKAFPGARYTINLRVTKVWYDLQAQAQVVLSSLERLSARRKRLQASAHKAVADRSPISIDVASFVDLHTYDHDLLMWNLSVIYQEMTSPRLRQRFESLPEALRQRHEFEQCSLCGNSRFGPI